MRTRPNADLEAVVVLGTQGARERRLLSRRQAREVEHADPAPVPTSRATLVRPEPFGSADEAQAWLAGVRTDREHADAELADALARLKRVLHAHRLAAADPYTPEVTLDRALVARVGYGGGGAVADGQFDAAIELEGTARRKPRRSMEAPDERFAALLGGRAEALACEELVLRARADLDAGRLREAALQARVGLEALLAELPSAGALGRSRGELEGQREPVGRAANAALRGELPLELRRSVTGSVEAMEAVLRRLRLGG